MNKYVVKMNSKTIRQDVEMRNVGIWGIVFHYHQDTARLNPCGDLLRVRLGHIVRVRGLDRNVRRHNDIELYLAKVLNGWRGIQRFRRYTVPAKQVGKQGIAAVAEVGPLVVKVFHLTSRILPSLAVEPGVEQHRLSTSAWICLRKLR